MFMSNPIRDLEKFSRKSGDLCCKVLCSMQPWLLDSFEQVGVKELHKIHLSSQKGSDCVLMWLCR